MCSSYEVPKKSYITEMIHLSPIFTFYVSEPLYSNSAAIVWWLQSTSAQNSVPTRVGISGTTAKSRQRKFVPLSHPGPFAVVATSRKSQTKVGTLACFDLL